MMIVQNKKYSGFLWHFIFAGLFIGLSLLGMQFLEGIAWNLFSAFLRIIFGIAILVLSSKLFEKKAKDILENKNTKTALIAGSGFLLYFVYYIITVASGFGKVAGLTLGYFISKAIIQQITTGFYEELNYRFLLLEGLKYTKNTITCKLLYVFLSSILFGLLHCVTGWNTYTFLQTGAIGFAFAVMFVKSENIVLPMILHFLYDIIAVTAPYIEWDHNPLFDNISYVFEFIIVIMFVISFVMLIVLKEENVPHNSAREDDKIKKG